MKGVNLMNPVLKDSGEIDLIVNTDKIVPTDGLEEWQVDQLVGTAASQKETHTNRCLMEIEDILDEWIHSLSQYEWNKIRRQGSLWGISIPNDWVKVWRFILKEPALRDSERAVRNGRKIGTYTHLWNLWSEECIENYLSDLEKELLWYVDNGYLYQEIGELMVGKYGDEFWKPRKEKTKTTPAQVVNYYLYWKMPNKIAKKELYDLCKTKIFNYDRNKEQEKELKGNNGKIIIG